MNQLKHIDFRGGQVQPFLKNLDFNLPLEQQQDLLTEDICQVSYGSYIIDVGWYGKELHRENTPSFNILVVKNANWEDPLIAVKCSSLEEVKQTIERCIEKVCDEFLAP